MDYANGGWKSSPYAKFIPGVGTGIDVDGLNGFQCKDFVDGYSRSLGIPFKTGNAITLWQPQPGWTQEATPQPGDVFVRDAIFNNFDYGDTGIVTEVTPTGVKVVQQNLAANLSQGSPPAPFFWPFYAIKGYLRKEENMTPQEVSEAYANYAGLTVPAGSPPTLNRQPLEFFRGLCLANYDTIKSLQKQLQAASDTTAQQKLNQVKAIVDS